MTTNQYRPDDIPPEGRIGVKAQFIKDLSFEVPSAPMIHLGLRSPPRLERSAEISTRLIPRDQPVHEVTLTLTLRASNPEIPQGGPVDFLAQLTYAGLFSLSTLEPEDIEAALYVDCPHILYPFAWNILSDLCRDANFPPISMQPIDFLQLWQNRSASPGVPLF